MIPGGLKMSINPQTPHYDSCTNVRMLTRRSCHTIKYNSADPVILFKEKVITSFQLDLKPDQLRIVYADKELKGTMGSLGIDFARVGTLFAIPLK
jgi:hypothetical protein